jgi:chromosome segregation ATPase
MSGESLDVQAVVDQFRESEQTLDEIRERLRSIVLAEEGADHAAESIEAASTRLAATATALEDHLAQVKSASEATVDALEAAQRFLAGTDLTALRSEVSSSAEQTREGFASLQAQITELSARIPQVDQLRAELEALKQQIPAHTRKKMGV